MSHQLISDREERLACPASAKVTITTAAACGFQREDAQAVLAQAVREDAQRPAAGDPWAVAMERLLERRSR